MKRYYVSLLGVIILVSASFIYKINQRSIYGLFKFDTTPYQNSIENPFYLFIFFSKQNCISCLEIIGVLNRLSEPYKVIGVVPDKEISEMHELRSSTGATFDIIGAQQFRRVKPPYSPTVIGVSRNKNIYFVIPAVPGAAGYFERFLAEFYDKAYPLILVN